MKFYKKPIDADVVKEMAAKYGLTLLASSILARRSITAPEDVMFILEDELRYLHNPFLFFDMEDVVERILAAADEGEKVIVFGDRDADGIISTVLIVDKLKEIGIDVSWSLPIGDEPYGFTKEKVQEFAEKSGTLIISVDCGISCVNEIDYAKELGIDTIVLDHHVAGEILPDAFAIINPKLEDCGYPFQHLAGCGVAAKVIWALGFSQTELYKKDIALLNIAPANGNTWLIEVQKIFNLVKNADPVREAFDTTVENNPQKQNLIKYLSSSVVVVYNAKQQKKFFSSVFGSSIELNVLDIAEPCGKLFPKLNGLSLLEMREISRDVKYTNKQIGEIDVLYSLFSAVAAKQNNLWDEKFEGVNELAAIGSIADMMPLVNENRIIVKRGIKNIQKTANKGLHELLFKQKLLDKPLSAADIAWNITPLINATGRMGVPDKAAKLFFSNDLQEIRTLADEIISLNKERKKLGETCWEAYFASAKKNFEEMEHLLVIAGGSTVNRGITGILAARLANYFNAPAIAYTVIGSKVVGSVRSIKKFSISLMLKDCSDLFIDCGGHDFAGGFSMEAGNLDALKIRLFEYAKKNISPVIEEEIIEIDAELPQGYLNQDVVNAVDILMPFGEGHRNIVFFAHSLNVKSMEIIGSKTPAHLKFALESGGVPWKAILWNGAERAGKDVSVSDNVNVIFRIKHNFIANNVMPELEIIDFERVK